MTRNNSSIQSFSRGLAVLRLLAERGEMTATEIARALGLHQSSASRLLRSLEQEGYVYKPRFHRFALDVNVLLFAGAAMEHFGEVRTAARVCSELHERLGCGAACVMLREGRLIYLARIHEGTAAVLSLVDDSAFPVHRSTPGLLLAGRLGREGFSEVMRASMARNPEPGPSPEQLWTLAEANTGDDRVLYLRAFAANLFSASLAYQTPRGVAALTLYSQTTVLDRAKAASELVKATESI